MTYITEKSEYTGDDVPLLDTETAVKGYDGTDIGPANSQAQVLANRTKWLKDKQDETGKTISSLTDTTEKIKLDQSSIVNQLSKVSTMIKDVDTNSSIRDNKLEVSIKAQKKTLSSNIDSLNEKITSIDQRVQGDVKQIKSGIQDLTIGLGQATTDIADNKLAIKNIESDLTLKQEVLKTGVNVNGVFGIPLEDVRDGGITLSDAKDFTDVLKSHFGVGKGLVLSESADGQSLELNIVKEENLGSNLNIRVLNVPKNNQEVELKTKQRPGYNLRAFAFKSSSTNPQPALTVKFVTDPNGQLVSPYEGTSMFNRISFSPDTTTARWSTVKTLKIDSNLYPDTRMAVSADGDNWYTYSTEKSAWIELGQLKVDKNSADILVNQGINLKTFATLDAKIIGDWLSSSKDTPSLNLAFANSVSSASQVFVPEKMVVTFNSAPSWTLQSPYFVPVIITRDSIIFKPTYSGDYVFCFEFQK